ncbi:PREDICTED: mucin-5AC-like [Dinoponera quadriceps]|uniref:Mucin-5AC-like n=1 Tax=Dinoponera quadriceps TaxID=609295 RepID=A0A6P3YB59_DINQU|nr:PREDICTED: mucin-5AC-like [Dinoponera quadriceps]
MVKRFIERYSVKMRTKMFKLVVVLLVAGSGDTRPQKNDDSSQAPKATEVVHDAKWNVRSLNKTSHDIVRDDSSGQSNNTNRDLKDLQYMDQSLRTVATQLLNVTSPENIVKVSSHELIKADHGTTQKISEKSDASLIKEINSEISNLESMGVSFGRPINSKFSYFESSHPGQAMAITEEELEREMSTTRLITAYKNHPTTTGGISTWILLNPPSTTAKSVVEAEKKTKQPFQTEVRLTVRPSSSIERVEKIAEKTTQLTPVVVSTKKPTSTTLKKITTTLRPERITPSLEKVESSSSSTTPKTLRTTTTSATTNDEVASTIFTTKKNQASRTTAKPKVTTSRTTSKPTSAATKPLRPAGQQGRPKPPTPTRRNTVKPEMVKNETASTGKIEKVTFKPVQMITTPKSRPESTERPMFVTKIKASVLMDTQKAPTTLLPAVTLSTASKTSNLSGADLVEVPVRSKPVGTKVNNVLKVLLKKPTDETTQIEIEPIKVNAPILKIEKVNKDKLDAIVEKDTAGELSNSRIDLKFDFNPELTKINVETQTEVATTTTSSTTSATSTKRPRHNSKRKKNKVRRRKPASTSSVAPSSTTASIMSTLMETSVIDSTAVLDNAVQESKIAPETKIANATKTKKKQPQKAISTQIYNFLSREVMPSFGVMSLVGLGLGLASYFLYPFGGTISRRNYEVEPSNYKYNLEDYDGNYGQSEEEVLSKVFQGMTGHESKYPSVKDLNGNYYHYQHYDGAYDAQTTKRIDSRYPSISTSPLYRPSENTQSAVKYRNTEYNRYSETTPIYYDHAEGLVLPGSANRQFVVGNVPKEYPFDVKTAALVSKKDYESAEDGQTQFDIAQTFNFPSSSGNAVRHGSAVGLSSTTRPDDGYEEIEITPTAVAVEHGPRSLKVKRATDSRLSRPKRESVIQVIPSKHELEEEEKEEDLSNEILDIIDLALPAGDDSKTRNTSEHNNEVEDLEAQKRKRQEETNTRVKESVMGTYTTTAEETTKIPQSTWTIAEKTPSKEKTTEEIENVEATTIEWFESSTTQKPAEGFSLFGFVKKVAEIKFRLGLTILKHASEGFARYLGHVQKRINGEE